MNEEARKKLQEFQTAHNPNQENQMSQNQEHEQTKTNPNTGDQPGIDEKKGLGDKAKGMFKVAYDKTVTVIKGGYGFAAESFATAYNAVIQYFQEIKKNIEEKGVMRWFADGFRKNAYGFLKLSLKVTAFVLVHNLIINATGFSILNPIFLLSILAVAVGLSIYSSYKAQKNLNNEVSAKTVGSHLVQEMMAA